MSEHSEQTALFDWAKIHEQKYPVLGLLFAIPNGGYRHIATAMKLKAEGVKPGVFDICIPFPMKQYHGAYIEMKVGKNKLSDNQKHWADIFVKNGYFVAVCYGWVKAAREICQYLNLPEELLEEL